MWMIHFKNFDLVVWRNHSVIDCWPALILGTGHWQVIPLFVYQYKCVYILLTQRWIVVFLGHLRKSIFKAMKNLISSKSEVVKESTYKIDQVSRTRLVFMIFFSARFLQLTLYIWFLLYCITSRAFVIKNTIRRLSLFENWCTLILFIVFTFQK